MKFATASLALFMLHTIAFATDRFYGDHVERSPGGTRRIEAKSPDNAGGRGRAFAAHFVYTLFDEKTGKEIWTRKQPMKKDSGYESPDGEGSPSLVRVDDAGRVVVYTGWQELLLLDPENGNPVVHENLLEQFSAEDRKNHVHDTTAGPMWASLSHWYFMNTEKSGWGSGEYFVIRPYWGARVTLDLKEQRIVDPRAAGAALVAAAEKEERAWVLAGLERFKSGESPDEKDYDARFELHKVLWLAGVLKVGEAVDVLRKFENDSWCGSSSSGGSTLAHRCLNTRQIAHLSLRRLGKAPLTPAAEILVAPGDRGARSREEMQLKSKIATPDRAENVDKVKQGMSAADMVTLIGGPDFSVYRNEGHSFEYDIDAKEPFTLRILIDEEGTVTIVLKVSAAWTDGTQRDQDLAD